MGEINLPYISFLLRLSHLAPVHVEYPQLDGKVIY